MSTTTLFQYCQKLIILSPDMSKVLLARRKGEADYNETYSFIGGKMETTDESILAGMKREKDEEIGSEVKVKLLPQETYNLLFRKKDGTSMILPHIPGVYVSGDIKLNEEYSEYQWVPVEDIDSFEPKIESVAELTRWAVRRLSNPSQDFVEV